MCSSWPESCRPSLIITTPCIAVVDDDRLVLRAIQRMLLAAQPEWRVEVFADPIQALSYIETRAHVLITELDLSRLSGRTLLEHVRAHHPSVVRLIHTHRPDDTNRPPLRGLGHRVLPKPVNRAGLLASVKWGLELRAVVNVASASA